MKTLIITEKTDKELNEQEQEDLSRYIPLLEELPIVEEVNGEWKIRRISTRILVPPEYLKGGAYKGRTTLSYTQSLAKEYEERGLTPPKNKPLEFRLCEKIDGVRDLPIGQLTDKEIDLIVEYYQKKVDYYPYKNSSIGKTYPSSRRITEELTRVRPKYKDLFSTLEEEEFQIPEEVNNVPINKNYLGLQPTQLQYDVIKVIKQQVYTQSKAYNNGIKGGIPHKYLPKSIVEDLKETATIICLEPHKTAKQVYGLEDTDLIPGNQIKAVIDAIKQLSGLFYFTEGNSEENEDRFVYKNLINIIGLTPKKGNRPGQIIVWVKKDLLPKKDDFIRSRGDELKLLKGISRLGEVLYDYYMGRYSRDMPTLTKEGYIDFKEEDIFGVCRAYSLSYDLNPGRLKKDIDRAHKELKDRGFILSSRSVSKGTSRRIYFNKEWLKGE